MLKLDDNLLQQIGLGTLPPDEKKNMLKHIYETLEMRVGVRLAEQMTDAQLDEFEKFVQAQDDNGAFHWLETNFPNYKDVVADEFEKLKNEVAQVAPQIIADAQARVTGAGAPQQPAIPQQPQPQPQIQPQQQYAPQQPQQYQQPAPQQYQQPQYQPPSPQPQQPYQPPQPGQGQQQPPQQPPTAA